MSATFTIRGQVTTPNQERVAGLAVRAFDRDLRSEQFLGQDDVAADGSFEIGYTADRFRRAEKATADLLLRVIDVQGSPVRILRLEIDGAATDPLRPFFNAPSELEVEVVVESAPPVGASEFEQLTALLAPVVDGVPLSELTGEDVSFLVHELELDGDDETRTRIEWLRRGATLAVSTGLPAEPFYGWGRRNMPDVFEELASADLAELPSILTRLLALPDDDLQHGLREAISGHIIPDSFSTWATRLPLILAGARNAGELRACPPGDGTPRVSGRLLDARTGAPLEGYVVHGVLHVPEREPHDLGGAASTADGRFDFVDPARGGLPNDGAPPLQLAVVIDDPAGKRRLDTQVPVTVDGDPGPIFVPREEDQPPAPPALADLAASGGPQLSATLLDRLNAIGASTLADLPTRGGVSRLDGLPDSDRAAAQSLGAHADLYRFSPDVRANAALIDAASLVPSASRTPGRTCFSRARAERWVTPGRPGCTPRRGPSETPCATPSRRCGPIWRAASPAGRATRRHPGPGHAEMLLRRLRDSRQPARLPDRPARLRARSPPSRRRPDHPRVARGDLPPAVR